MIMPMEKHVKTENCAGQTMSCGDEGGFSLFRNDYSRLRRCFSDADALISDTYVLILLIIITNVVP